MIWEDSSTKTPLMMRFLVPVVSSCVSYNFRLKSWTPFPLQNNSNWHLEFRQLPAFNQSFTTPNPPKDKCIIHLSIWQIIQLIISGNSSLPFGVPVYPFYPSLSFYRKLTVSFATFQVSLGHKGILRSPRTCEAYENMEVMSFSRYAARIFFSKRPLNRQVIHKFIVNI